MTTNEERFRTKEERSAAFLSFCKKMNGCKNCPLSSHKSRCTFVWLTLEAEKEKPLHCPCCGGASGPVHGDDGFYYVQCEECGLRTERLDTADDAIAVWNRRVKG